MKEFDLLVAGAGTAGATVAKIAAEGGLSVCLIDTKPREEIGIKICGDAIGKHHFSRLGIKEPGQGEFERVMEGIRIYSPDQKTSYQVVGEKLYGYILDRHRFGQRLVDEALDVGVNLYDRTQALIPIIKNGYVRGLRIKNHETGELKNLKSPVVIEATGFFAAIRKKLTHEMGIDLHIDNKDVEACYREIRQLRNQLDDPTMCQIYLNQSIAPGGYYWIFPKVGTTVNVGLGVSMTEGFPNPRRQFYEHVISQPLFKGSIVLDKGSWCVPTRRPLDNMVSNGILILGDAACQVNPIHGGGIGPSMIGGTIAGKTVIEALGNKDISQKGLWDYNVKYIREYGSKQAGLEVFRILLQNLEDEDLNFGMEYKLLTEEDLLRASTGEDIHFTIFEKAQRAFRSLRKLPFLTKLRNAAKLMKEIRAWYFKYPKSPQDFTKWKVGAEEIFKKVTNTLHE